MAVGPVARRAARDAAEADLEQLVPLAVLVVARVHQVRAVREAGGVEHIGRALAQQAAHDVEDAAEQVGAARQRGRALGLQDAAGGDLHVDEFVEAVVEQDLRVEDVDEEGAQEHLEHLFVEEEIDRADRLRVGAGEVEVRHIALAPQAARDLVRPHAHAVVVDVVLEVGLLLGHHHLDDGAHRALVAVEHLGHRRDVVIDAEARHDLVHTPFGQAQRGQDGVEVGTVPLRHARIAQQQVQHLLVQHTLAHDLHRRNLQAFFEDLRRVGRQAARHLAAVVGHVAEHRGPAHQPVIVKDRHHRQPIVQVADGAVARVRVVGEKDIAFFDVAVVVRHEAVDEGAELADHHLAVVVGDHREGVVLLADAGRHRGAEQHGVHLSTRIAQRVFDDVERDRVELDRLERGAVGLDDSGGHGCVLFVKRSGG